MVGKDWDGLFTLSGSQLLLLMKNASESLSGRVCVLEMGEHMMSFDFAYKIEAVRDWLFAQSK